jgi:hypothetical protein
VLPEYCKEKVEKKRECMVIVNDLNLIPHFNPFFGEIMTNGCTV